MAGRGGLRGTCPTDCFVTGKTAGRVENLRVRLSFTQQQF